LSEHLTGDAAVAAALTHLLADHPELASVVWTVGKTPGVLEGQHVSDSGRGEIVDACAAVMGGHVARSTQYLDIDGHGLAQLVAVYDGVPVSVWASYPLPKSNLPAAELRRVLTGRPLGAVVCRGGAA
jgi:hypothetical protein